MTAWIQYGGEYILVCTWGKPHDSHTRDHRLVNPQVAMTSYMYRKGQLGLGLVREDATDPKRPRSLEVLVGWVWGSPWTEEGQGRGMGCGRDRGQIWSLKKNKTKA